MMRASDGAFSHMQRFIYLKDFATVWNVTEHRKFDAHEHYAAICELIMPYV